MRRSPMKRVAAMATALAVAGATMLALAPAAGAADAPVTSNTASTRPTILNNAAGQAAGNVVLNVGAAVATNTITLTLDDADGDPNCSVGVDFVSFAAAPTTNQPDLTVGAPTNTGTCPAGVNNSVTLTATDAFSGNVTISNLSYSVGGTAGAGLVKLTANGQTSNNAIIASVGRIDGANRYATAANIAQTAFPCSTTAIVASGENFPDALAANFLAGHRNAPVLLVTRTLVPSETAAAMVNLGVTDVIVVGGTEAVSNEVAGILATTEVGTCGRPGVDAPGTTKIGVSRIDGNTRYETAHLIAAAAGTSVGTFDAAGDCGTPVKTAILTSGPNYPDALAAGALSFQGSNNGAGCGDGLPLPLLLTEQATLNASAAAAIGGLDIANVIVIGGVQAVSDAVVASVDALPDVTVIRISGATRQATATELAELLLSRGYDGEAFVARGDFFADALVGGALAGVRIGPILLTASTSSLGAPATGFLADEESFNTAVLFGGIGALTNTVQDQVRAAFAGRSPTI